MRKEGKINYDSRNIAMILIISILIVLILIVGSLIYIMLAGEEERASGGASVNESLYSPYYLAYMKKNISLCDNANKNIENRCKVNFAHISGNASVCGTLNRDVDFAYTSKLKELRLNLNAADYCYMIFSKSGSDNYCQNIESESGRIICMEDLQ